jgi:MtfA peptidase
MIYLQAAENSAMNPTLKLFFIVITFVGLVIVVLSRVFIYIEQVYALKYNRPIFLNSIAFPKKLTNRQEKILDHNFDFIHKLTKKDKAIFKHRVARFIADKEFIGRQGLEPTDEMKVLIAATAVMLTFGFRNYLVKIIQKVIIYPEEYYSKLNETFHKGETNPKHKAIVFSWKDFEQGYHVGDDNLNLGIHEFGHAIHLNAFSNDDISSLIFNRGLIKLTNYLKNNESVRQELIKSRYFRAYAYTNQYEFFAVLLENFIETPEELRSKFPELYHYIKHMLNFNFAGY